MLARISAREPNSGDSFRKSAEKLTNLVPIRRDEACGLTASPHKSSLATRARGQIRTAADGEMVGLSTHLIVQ